jgi:hypothetical protein
VYVSKHIGINWSRQLFLGAGYLAIVHELTSFEKALTGKKCLLPDILALPADGFAGGSVKSGPL